MSDRPFEDKQKEDEPEWVWWPRGDGTSVAVRPEKARQMLEEERTGEKSKARKGKGWMTW